MEERRRTTSIRQLELLIEFLDEHKDLALGRVRSKEARALAHRLWSECAEMLNAEGPVRTSKEWTKVYCNFERIFQQLDIHIYEIHKALLPMVKFSRCGMTSSVVLEQNWLTLMLANKLMGMGQLAL